MKTSIRTVRLSLMALVLFAFLFPLAGGLVSGRASGEREPAGRTLQGSAQDEVILPNGFRIVFQGVTNDQEGKSTWQYFVEELPGSKDLGYWVLELPVCAPVAAASPNPWSAVQPDPKTQMDGIKWDTSKGFRSGTFTVTVQGQWAVGTTRVAAKGPDIAYGKIAGPDCSQNQSPRASDDYSATSEGMPVTIDVLGNDGDPDLDELSLAAFQTTTTAGGSVQRQDNGTPGDTGDDRLQFSPLGGFVGEDSFVYSISDGSLSSQATVYVTVQATSLLPDQNDPTVDWVSPVAAGRRLDVGEADPVVLEAAAADDRAVARVVFKRWDAVNEKYVPIANLIAAPYRTELNSSVLNPNWNQIFVAAVDTAGNQSDNKHIWLYKLTAVGTNQILQLYFPLIGK